MMVSETFKALGDPVRLAMIQRLSTGSAYTLGSLAENLGLTRQGARKHLQKLVDVKLVSLQVSGRQTDVQLETKSLAEAKAYISELEKRWDARLLALKEYVERRS